MPKIDIDYSNTIIYKITCKDPTVRDVYIGYTTNFVQRKHAHKHNYINNNHKNYNCKLYEAIRNNRGWSNWKMEIVGFFNCKDQCEVRLKEQEYIQTFGATLNSIKPMPKLKIEKVKYNCEICNVEFQSLKCMEHHNNTHKHIKKQEQQRNNSEMSNEKHMYDCILCNYHTNKKSDFNKHLRTPKHMKNKNSKTEVNNIHCNTCSLVFLTNSELCIHKQFCVFTDNAGTNTLQNTLSSVLTPKMFLDIFNQSKELQNILVEQTKELQQKLLEKENLVIDQQKQLIEMAKKPSMVNSNNNNNNQFNLNFFLNETCKNAMNIQDFISSIKLTTQDFETTGRIGFVDGISRIFINELKRLEVERRPLHCTDVKRETVYVKDNDMWEKENTEKKKLKWAINSIAQLNLNQVQEWQQEYPECRENNTVANTQFNKMAMVALGGFGDEEETKFRDKIVKNVLKEIVVSKEIE